MDRRRAFRLLAATIPFALAACASPDAAGSTDTAPVISIAGIVDGAAYDLPVTVLIAIDHGAYQAQLDGLPFSSGSSVATPGNHTLTIAAHAGVAAITRDIHFTIRAPTGGVLIIRMFDLGANDDGGGGDAILLTDSSAAGMTHVMIDAGPAGTGASDPGYVSRQLAALHVDTLALLVLTHAHSDHYGGMPAIVSATRIRQFIYNGQIRTLSSYNAFITQVRAAADSTTVLAALRDYPLGTSATPAHLKLLPPLATHLGEATDDGTLINDGSIGARLELGTFSMFFAGDGEIEATRTWRTQFTSLTQGLSVLKVGHHGANNAIFDNGFSGTASWLDQTQPKFSIVSSNGTTHPRIAAINRLLAQANNRTYCTNVHGNITLRVTRSGEFTISVARNADLLCVPGSGANT